MYTDDLVCAVRGTTFKRSEFAFWGWLPTWFTNRFSRSICEIPFCGSRPDFFFTSFKSSSPLIASSMVSSVPSGLRIPPEQGCFRATVASALWMRDSAIPLVELAA